MTDAVQPELAELCARLLDDLDEIGAELTRTVRREIPSCALLPEREHRHDVRGALEAMLRALPQGAAPTAAQLQQTESGALRRRAQGIPMHDVLAALQLVARLLWERLHALDSDGAALIAATPTLWRWMQRMSDTVVSVYEDSDAGDRGEHALRRQRLVELLCDGIAGDGRAATLARELGFDPGGDFVAIVADAAAWGQGRSEPLERELRRGAGIAHCGLGARLMVVLVQGAEPEDAVAAVLSLSDADGRAGIGVARKGPAGAADSIRDAELALAYTAPDRPVMAFETVWLRATLTGAETRLEPLLATARRVAAAHPDLEAAVIAFAKGGFSSVAAGEMLHVHPNTVRYRLGRWQELTGLDARDFQGLVRSVLALSPWSV